MEAARLGPPEREGDDLGPRNFAEDQEKERGTGRDWRARFGHHGHRRPGTRHHGTRRPLAPAPSSLCEDASAFAELIGQPGPAWLLGYHASARKDGSGTN